MLFFFEIWAGIYNEFHQGVFTGKIVQRFLKGILDVAISRK